MEADFRERLDRLESFMVENFTRSEVRMDRLEKNMERLETNMERMDRRVARYVRLGARQLRATDERITALVDSHHKLLEAQARTEKSLQALIDSIQRTNGR